MKKNKKIIFVVAITSFMFSLICIQAFNPKNENVDEFLDENNIVTYKLNKNLEQVKINNLMGQDVTIKYEKTMKYSEKESDIYLDDNENEYIYINDKQVGYIKNKDNNESKSIVKVDLSSTEEDDLLKKYEKTAYDFITNTLNLKNEINNYTLSSANYVSSYNELSYSYCKTISGINTTDCIHMSLDLNGEISSYSISNQNVFDSILDKDIDMDCVNSFIKSEVDKKYGNVDYEKFFFTIKKEKDNFIIECNIAITHPDGMRSGESFYYILN